jgi:hypothetical protein
MHNEILIECDPAGGDDLVVTPENSSVIFGSGSAFILENVMHIENKNGG